MAAAATEPQAPWDTTVSLEGQPVVGAEVKLVADVRLNGAIDANVEAVGADTVTFLDGPQALRGEAGETATLSWRLRVDEAGPWDAAVAVDDSSWCCLRGWSTATDGAWARPGEEPPWPRPALAFDLQTELLDDANVRLIHTVTASGWAAAGEVHVSASRHATSAGNGTGSPSATVAQDVALADGGGAVVTRFARIDWPSLHGSKDIGGACENVELERNGGVRPIDSWSCETTEARGLVPAIGAALGVAALLGLATVMRAAGRQR